MSDNSERTYNELLALIHTLIRVLVLTGVEHRDVFVTVTPKVHETDGQWHWLVLSANLDPDIGILKHFIRFRHALLDCGSSLLSQRLSRVVT
jgi:hypothetical protein